MYKIGIIGPRDSVMGYLSLGFHVADAATVEDATRELHAMVKSGEYAVIFLTEGYARLMEEETGRYQDLPLPAIVSVPGQEGSTGYGVNSIRHAVERAVGADILFRE